MSGFIDYAISHARLTIVTLLFLLLAGFVAYVTIPKEAGPIRREIESAVVAEGQLSWLDRVDASGPGRYRLLTCPVPGCASTPGTFDAMRSARTSGQMRTLSAASSCVFSRTGGVIRLFATSRWAQLSSELTCGATGVPQMIVGITTPLF